MLIVILSNAIYIKNSRKFDHIYTETPRLTLSKITNSENWCKESILVNSSSLHFLCCPTMYEQEFKYVFKLFSFVGMHPMKKLIRPLIIINFILTLYVTILILLKLLFEAELVVLESVGVFSQVFFQMLIQLTIVLTSFKVTRTRQTC